MSKELAIMSEERRRLYWACRRGMLELDQILIPFLERHYERCTKEEQACFAALLKEEDPDLFTWLLTDQSCPAYYQALIDLIHASLSTETINFT